MSRLSILFLTTILPGTKRTGGEIVTAHVVSALRRLGHDVHALGYGRHGYVPAEGETLVECRPIETNDAPRQAALWYAQAIARGRAYSIQKYVGKTYETALERALGGRHWDRVIVDHAQLAWLMPRLRGRRLIHMSHNVEAAIYAEQAKTGPLPRRLVFEREARLVRRSENALARAASCVWTLTKAQADHFSNIGAASVATLPVPSMRLPANFRLGKPEFDIGLIGTWSWRPNRVGLDWFCDLVVPHLPKGMKVVVAGKGAEDLAGRFPNLLVLGRVPNAATFLASAKCIAVPSIAGDGIQIKTLDSIAVGRPVVATSFALRGIDDMPSRMHVTDDPRKFAHALGDAALAPECAARDDWAQRREERFLRQVSESLAV